MFSALALIVYPIATEVSDNRKMSPLQTYGAGYWLAWLADAFFAAAAVCMELDELAHAWLRPRPTSRHDAALSYHHGLGVGHGGTEVGGYQHNGDGGGTCGGGTMSAFNTRHVAPTGGVYVEKV